MAFQMPEYHQPDFSKEQFIKAPDAKLEIVEIDGLPQNTFTVHLCSRNILRSRASGC